MITTNLTIDVTDTSNNDLAHLHTRCKHFTDTLHMHALGPARRARLCTLHIHIQDNWWKAWTGRTEIVEMIRGEPFMRYVFTLEGLGEIHDGVATISVRGEGVPEWFARCLGMRARGLAAGWPSLSGRRGRIAGTSRRRRESGRRCRGRRGGSCCLHSGSLWRGKGLRFLRSMRHFLVRVGGVEDEGESEGSVSGVDE